MKASVEYEDPEREQIVHKTTQLENFYKIMQISFQWFHSKIIYLFSFGGFLKKAGGHSITWQNSPLH